MNLDDPPALQRDVQRLLGRCMLRLQQYERLLKTMLAHQQLAGAMQELEEQREAQIEEHATKTLGTLVKRLFEAYVVVDGDDRPLLLDESKLPAGAAGFGFRLSLPMSPESRVQLRGSLDELVALRNDLVHHLIERFDLWSIDGCIAASEHLFESYARIDERYDELWRLANQMDETRQRAAAFIGGEEFQNLLLNGISPDGTVDWSHAGIVRALRAASAALALDGWVALDSAVAWMAEHHGEQIPSRYRCRSWPQVLQESNQFELQYRGVEGGRREAWYRIRTRAS